MNKVILSIGGMSCSSCSNTLEKYLNKQDGIIDASINLVMGTALIRYDNKIKLKDIERYIKEAGFESLGIYKEVINYKEKNFKKIIISSILLVISIILMFFIKNKIILYIYLVLPLLFLIYGRDILANGLKRLFKSPNMYSLVSISVLFSLFFSIYNLIINKNYYYFESIITVIYFVKLGKYIDESAKEEINNGIRNLVQLTPKEAIVKRNNKEEVLSIDEIKKGDIVIAKPGDRIAVDGLVVSGKTHIDESIITGESMPVKKEKDSYVIAGSINMEGYIEYKAEKIGKESSISEIVRLVVESSNNKIKLARLADKISSYFIPVVFIIAILTFVIYMIISKNFNTSITRFITILVIACPCSIGLATPLSIVISNINCLKNGIIIKSPEVLENASKIDTVVFDKTGILTKGTLKIFKLYNFSKHKEKELLTYLCSLEDKVTHPISTAFKNYKEEHNIKLLDVKEFENINGIGIRGIIDSNEFYLGSPKLIKKLDIHNKYKNYELLLENEDCSIIYIVENMEVVGLIGVRDVIRDNVKEVVRLLKEDDINIIMLTGDNEKVSNIIASNLGIDNVISNVLPKDKNKVINKLLKEGKKVMMVGDGINDAPALVSSTIGVSISNASDVAIDSSLVILLNDNIDNIRKLLNIGKITIKNIKENIFWAFFYNIIMILLATGLFSKWGLNINPTVASIMMSLSSLTVILNALRLRK